MKIMVLFFIFFNSFSPNVFGQKSSWQWSISVSGSASHFRGKDAQATTLFWPINTISENIPDAHFHAYDNGGRIINPGFSVGFGLSRKLSTVLFLQVDILLSSEGGAVRLEDQLPQYLVFENDREKLATGGNGKAFFQLAYLKFPVSIKWIPRNHKAIYFSAGMYYAALLEASERGKFNGGFYPYNPEGRDGPPDPLRLSYKQSSPYGGNDFGLCLGGGYRLHSVHKLRNMEISAEYWRGLQNISRLKEIPGHYTDATSKFFNESWSIGLAWYFIP